MTTMFENKRRKLVEEIGHYMNTQYTVYDNTGTMEVWFSNKTRALEWWSKNSDRETFSEKREKQRLEVLAVMEEYPYEELPFM